MTASLELQVWTGAGGDEAGFKALPVEAGQSGSLLSVLRKSSIAFNGDDESGLRPGLLVNGIPQFADEVELSSLDGTVFLEPFQSFPHVKDLKVDLSPLERDLRAVDALAPESLKAIGAISNCLRCGLCQELCPDYSQDGNYMGPAPIVLLDWGNQAKGGEELRKERMQLMTSDRGVHHDRYSFAFDTACPNEISLRRSMARAKRDASWYWLKTFLEQ